MPVQNSADSRHPQAFRSPRLCRPYQRQAQEWMERLTRTLEATGIGRAACMAFKSWALDESSPGTLDWTSAQLARKGKCDPTTVRRAIPALLAAGLVAEVSPASHACHRAAVYRLSETFPTFGYPVGKRPLTPSENAKSPSPQDYQPKVGVPKANITVPSHQDLPPEHLDGDGHAELAKALRGLGCDPVGAYATARNAKNRHTMAAILTEHGQALLQACEKEATSNARGLLCHRVSQKPWVLRSLADRIAHAHKLAEDSQERHTQAFRTLRVELDAQGLQALAQWLDLRKQAPAPLSSGSLDHCVAERKAFESFRPFAENALANVSDLRVALKADLLSRGLLEGTLVWKRAWDYHWMHKLGDAVGYELPPHMLPTLTHGFGRSEN